MNRAVVLLGPRRVGKTILVYHAIQELIDRQAVSGRDILYV
ncbi:AAA family ATPase, partial [Thiolapillus sp.]